MHPTLENLRELQQVDTLILQLKKKQTQLNDGSALKKELETVQSNLTKASEKLRNSKAEQQDSELKLKTIESKKKNYERKLHSDPRGVTRGDTPTCLQHERHARRRIRGAARHRQSLHRLPGVARSGRLGRCRHHDLEPQPRRDRLRGAPGRQACPGREADGAQRG
jgi:cob(I)alamin adenosyltransferase